LWREVLTMGFLELYMCFGEKERERERGREGGGEERWRDLHQRGKHVPQHYLGVSQCCGEQSPCSAPVCVCVCVCVCVREGELHRGMVLFCITNITRQCDT